MEVGVRVSTVVLVAALLAGCAEQDPPPTGPPTGASAGGGSPRWTQQKCLDKAGVIGLMLHDLGADDAVEYTLQKAEDHGCDIRSAGFDRAMKEGFDRAEGVEDDLAALAECDQVIEAIFEARQIGDLVTARDAERYYERHCT